MVVKNNKKLDETRKLPCCVCGRGAWDMDRGEYRNEAHHVKAKGMGGGKRDDENVVSLCSSCHLELHSYPKTFKEKRGEDVYRKLRGLND